MDKGAGSAAGRGGGLRLTALMYHDVCGPRSEPGPHDVSAERFAGHVAALRSRGFNACRVDEYVAWLAGDRELPERSVLLTFDDGYEGLYEHVFPVLRAAGWPAAVFVTTGLFGRTAPWRKEDGEAAHRILSGDRIREMAASGLFAFHSHTVTHPDLTRLSGAEARRELEASKGALEDLLGGPVSYLAYPYGRVSSEVADLARDAGYTAGFSVLSGFNRPGMDRFRIRRLDVRCHDTPRRLLRKVVFGTNDGSLRTVLGYYVGRAVRRFGAYAR